MFASVPLNTMPCTSWHASQVYANAPTVVSCVEVPVNVAFVFPCVVACFDAGEPTAVAWHALHAPLTVVSGPTRLIVESSRFVAYVVPSASFRCVVVASWQLTHVLFAPGFPVGAPSTSLYAAVALCPVTSA